MTISITSHDFTDRFTLGGFLKESAPPEVNQAYANYQKKVPRGKLNTLETQSSSLKESLDPIESKLREISPLILKEIPYSPKDHWVVKLAKSVVASIKVLHAYVANKEVRSMIHKRNDLVELKSDLTTLHYHLKKIGDTISEELKKIPKEISKANFKEDDTKFTFDFLESAIECARKERNSDPGEGIDGASTEENDKRISKEALVGRFNENLRHLMLADRGYAYIDEKTYDVKTEKGRTELAQERNQHYNNLYDKLEQEVEGISLEDLELRFNSVKEDLKHDNTIRNNLGHKSSYLEDVARRQLGIKPYER